jgi:glyoxylase-like metal-dependent hydrolase (beta-lactamase superfamily II)
VVSEPWAKGDVDFGRVRVLVGDRGGKYPSGNSIWVRGSEETALIDPSISLIPRRAELESAVDRVVNSHCHEDHIAGNHLFPEAPWHVHEADVMGFQSLDDMMAIYGYPEPIHSAFTKTVLETFHWVERADAVPYRDGDVFELGQTRIRVLHLPGHTRGHCALWVEPEDVLYLADIDLSSFGPYYGDAWSDLADFERTLERVRELDARYYATFHHIGVLEGRAAFLERLDRFSAVIRDRERRLLDYLAEPRTLDEIAEHRFVFRPKDPVAFAVAVERRSMAQHVDRLLEAGRVSQVEPDRFVAVPEA